MEVRENVYHVYTNVRGWKGINKKLKVEGYE